MYVRKDRVMSSKRPSHREPTEVGSRKSSVDYGWMCTKPVFVQVSCFFWFDGGAFFS